MSFSHLKITLRTLRQHQVYSLINILGLAVGMAICLLIFLFVRNEHSFDRFHTQGDRIFRLAEVQTFGVQSEQKVALSMPLMGETMREDFPEVVAFTRFFDQGKSLYRAGEQQLFIQKTAAVDSNFLEMFNFRMIAGDPRTALVEPQSIVLTESVARSFFDDADPLGQTLANEGDQPLRVTGILADVPDNSHLQFNALTSITSFSRDTTVGWFHRWGSNFLVTYLQLEENADPGRLEAQFDDYLVRHTGEEALEYYQLFLQPLREIHLGSTDITHDYQNWRKFDRKYVSLFTLLGLFVLIIAGINFMNLSTARSLQRAREVGIRKTIGAGRPALVRQFLGESIVLAFVALILGIFLAELLVGTLNRLADRNLELAIWSKPLLLSTLLAAGAIIGVLAGIYPALVLSSFRPLQAIQQQTTRMAGRRFNFRSVLVVTQFAIAIGLIVGTLIVTRQYRFLRNLDPGFAREQVLILQMNREINEKYELLRAEFEALPGVLGVTASGQRLGNNLHQTSLTYETGAGAIEESSSSFLNADYGYLSFYDLELIAGREFSRDNGTDLNHAYIVNETLAKSLDWENPIGKKFSMGSKENMGTVIGIVRDFNYNSLHHKVEPLFITVQDWGFSELSVRIDAGKVEQAIAGLRDKWTSVLGGRPFEYEFLDEHFAQLYRSEQQVSQVVTVLASLAIFIACLGLFGLATVATEQRTKEIGIRKIMGASIRQLIVLLSKDFTRLVLLALLVASPVTWWLLKDWLNGFAYRTNIGWWMFALAGTIALTIAWLTISLKSIRSARANPVEALRHE